MLTALVAAPAGPLLGETYNGYDLPSGWKAPVMDREIHRMTLFEKLELSSGESADALVADVQGWIGGDHHRFWWKAEMQQDLRRPQQGEVELQALYGKLVAPFWDLQAGVRIDRIYSGTHRNTRAHLAVGFQGIAPYWFELEPTLFLSEDGDLRLELEAAYELLLTQRLVLEPSVDVVANLGPVQDPTEGRGLAEMELGLRLRYDVTRQIGPYVGITWTRALGATSGLRRAQGEDISVLAAVVGVRAWF